MNERTRRLVAVSARVLFGIVAAVHLYCQGTPDSTAAGRIADATQPLLMPLLAILFLLATRRPRSRTVRWVLVALGFSWLGDSVPRLLDGDASFLAMVGCFLLAQLAYIAAFWPFRVRSVLFVGRAALVGYLAVVGLLIAVCAPGAGGLLVPVLIYGLCLGLMAVLATGLGPLVGIGGALFLISDGLIAVDAFSEVEVPQNSLLVMVTYLVAQTLIAFGVARSERVNSPGTGVPAGG